MRLNKIQLRPTMFFFVIFLGAHNFSAQGQRGLCPVLGLGVPPCVWAPAENPNPPPALWHSENSPPLPLNQEVDSSKYRIYSLKEFFPAYFSVIQKNPQKPHRRASPRTLFLCSNTNHAGFQHHNDFSLKKMALKTKLSSSLFFIAQTVLSDKF